MGVPDLVGMLFAALGGTAHEICNSMRDPSFLLRIVVNSDKKTGFCSVLFQELSPPGVAHFAGSIKTKKKKKPKCLKKSKIPIQRMFTLGMMRLGLLYYYFYVQYDISSVSMSKLGN